MPTDIPLGITPTYTQQYRRCGKPSCPLCAAGGRGHGPYWYAYWREGGRTRSRYLGKQPPAGVALPTAPAAGPETATVAPTARSTGPGTAQHVAVSVVPPASRVRTMGGFALWRDGERLTTERWERQKIGALFKWLLGAPGHRLTRDEVVERFWPEGAPERGMANLRVLVHRLRKVLEEVEGDESDISYDGEVLALRPGAEGWLDAEDFSHAAHRVLARRDPAACRAALALYTGDYLPDDAYEEWAVGRREELIGQRVVVLLHLAALCTAAGEVEEAEGCLHAILTQDRCHEEAALALMRLYAAARPGQALRVYRRLAQALNDELDLGPEEETAALAHALATRQATAPAVSVADMAPTNLPAALTSFIGRRRELADLHTLLHPARTAEAAAVVAEITPCRLLTLTGLGGTGKTRLALQLANELLDEPGLYADGVWLAELASLNDPALVLRVVAATLGIEEEAVRPLLDTLTAWLQGKRLLLVIDNCEHLLDACADLAAALLAACPGLTVLATSRATLGVAGERRWPVPPLSLPGENETGPGGRLLVSEAVRLFLARARVQRPDLRETETNTQAVARICRQLEGIPLALELAAARVSVLSLEQIAARLSESFQLLTGGPRTAPKRQRTLHAALDWSYDLLSGPERLLLRRLAVFAGGCALEAVEAVCAGEGIVAEEVLFLLGGLVQHSLVQVADIAGVARYRLLETVRQYARAHLAASGELAMREHGHAAYYVALAEEAEPALTGAEQASWLARLETEHDNLRAVLRLARERGEHEMGLRVAGALWQFWDAHGHVGEGRRWLEELLAKDGSRERSDGASAIRARALNGAGGLAWVQGDYSRATVLHEQSLALRRDLGDMRGIAASLVGLGIIAAVQGDFARARILHEESLARFRDLGNMRGIAHSLDNLGDIGWAQGNYAWARALYEECLTLRRELDDKRGIAVCLNNLGDLAYAEGNFALARTLYEQSAALFEELQYKRGIAKSLTNLGDLAGVQGDIARAMALQKEGLRLFRELDDKWGIANSLLNLGRVACDQGDYAQARVLVDECLALRRELGDKWGIARCLDGMARVAAAPGTAPERLPRAARLFGAAAALREAIGTPRPPSERDGYEHVTAALRRTLSDAAFATAWSEGHALTLEQMIDLALAL